MNDPDWDAFISSVIGEGTNNRKRFVSDQFHFFGNRVRFGGFPAEWFRTLAGGILQELISRCNDDKPLVASRAGMSTTNLYSILNGNNDPKLGTLLHIIHANGFEFNFDLVQRF